MSSYTIVGVVGHIDHGKTSLVAALTGVNTDTHPEEKRRGITIDLGFASFKDGEDEFALIDAPGHQKYIGNLLAGVSAVDIGLLVVACDQGIQAQTLEHVAILNSLGVAQLIVVVSRVDLCDEAAIDSLTEELQVFLTDYGFEDFPVLPFSAVTCRGLDELRALLRHHARRQQRSAEGAFRMPVDRVFSVEGRGCVVAGTVWSGTVRVGDTVQVAGRSEARVRELEVHGEAVDHSQVGRRTAINLAGVPARELRRGDELVAPGAFVPLRRHLIEVAMFQDAAEVRCPAVVQLHTATTTCEARITGARRLAPGRRQTVVIDTDEPIVTTPGQPCLLRRPYPVGSFAGGRVLAPLESGSRHVRRLTEFGERLARSDDPAERLLAWIDHLGELTIDSHLAWRIGLDEQACQRVAAELVDEGTCLELEGRLLSRSLVERIRRRITGMLHEQAQQNDAWVDAESVVRRAGIGSPESVRWVVRQLVAEGHVVRASPLIALATDETKLSKKQKARMEQILQLLRGDRTPPTVKAAAEQLSIPADSAQSLVRFAGQQRLLTEISGGWAYSTDVMRQLLSELQQQFARQPTLTVAEIRDLWQVTRKYAVPLLEYCDRQQATVRQGDVRTAGPRLAELAGGEPSEACSAHMQQKPSAEVNGP